MNPLLARRENSNSNGPVFPCTIATAQHEQIKSKNSKISSKRADKLRIKNILTRFIQKQPHEEGLSVCRNRPYYLIETDTNFPKNSYLVLEHIRIFPGASHFLIKQIFSLI